MLVLKHSGIQIHIMYYFVMINYSKKFLFIIRFGEFVSNDNDSFGQFEDTESDMFKRENPLGKSKVK